MRFTAAMLPAAVLLSAVVASAAPPAGSSDGETDRYARSRTAVAAADSQEVSGLTPDEPDTLRVPALAGLSPPLSLRTPVGVRAVEVPGGLSALSGTGERVADAVGGRAVGLAWPGFRSGVASNVLPASMTSLVLDGRAVDDWLRRGIDPLSAYSTGGAVVAASGHDLAAVPWVWWSAKASASPAFVANECGPTVAFDSGWPLEGRPHARLTMSGGSRAWKETAFEFERGVSGGEATVRGAYRKGDGKGPESDSRHDSEHGSGAVLVGLADGWAARFAGIRGDSERSLPLDADSWRTVRTVDSRVSASVTDGRSSLGLHHGSTWVSSSLGSKSDGTLTVERNGFVADVAVDAWLMTRVSVFGEARRASGSLLASAEDTRVYGGTAEWRSEAWPGWVIEGSLGASVLGGDPLPSARAVASRLSDVRDLVVGVGLGGRQPTLLETRATRIDLSTGPTAIVSNADLEPELALSCFAEGRDRTLPVELGVRLDAARVFSPIVIEAAVDADTFSPENAEDGSSGSLTLWCGAERASGAALKLSATGRLFDESGPMNALSPVATYEARLAASLPVDLFDDYLHLVVGTAVAHAGGLASGPWAGEVDDTATSVSVSLSASAGDATLYAVAADLFDAAASTAPGMEAAGRTLHAGFSWDFWD